jgi:hypothetical protein
MWKIIIDFLKLYWREILMGILTTSTFISVRSCNDNAKEAARQAHNVQASLDTVRYYKDKNGDLYAEKLSFIASQDELKKINEDLSKNVEALNRKLLAGVNSTVIIHDTIDLTKNDNAIILDTLDYPQTFNLPLKDNVLTGNLWMNYYYKDRELSPIFFDYSLSLPIEVYVTKDYSIILQSNSNVRFNNITSFIDPLLTTKPKVKRWHLGVQSGVGFNYNLLKPSYSGLGIYVGFGLTYDLISF